VERFIFCERDVPPVEQPMLFADTDPAKYETVLMCALKAAKALGLGVPDIVLVRVDEVMNKGISQRKTVWTPQP
jgi:hypothetical protein